MSAVTRILLLVVLMSPMSAFAKGPWYEGTFSGAYPAHKDGKVTVVFEQNEVKKFVITNANGEFPISGVTLTHAAYFDFDWSFAQELKGTSQSGSPFEARLVSGNGMAEAAVLQMPSGVQVNLKKD